MLSVFLVFLYGVQFSESHHQEGIKKNIPYVLAKRIIGFNMKEFAIKMWLPQCNYPNDVTEKGIHNAMLQGPAPFKKNVKTVPLVSTYFSNGLVCIFVYYNNQMKVFALLLRLNDLRWDIMQ